MYWPMRLLWAVMTTWSRRAYRLGKDLTHAYGDGGLASAGGAGEGDRGLEPKLTAHLVQDEVDGNLLGALLHSNEADQLLVELVQLVLDALLEHEVVDSPRRSSRRISPVPPGARPRPLLPRPGSGRPDLANKN